jgi:hypothetical protein
MTERAPKRFNLKNTYRAVKSEIRETIIEPRNAYIAEKKVQRTVIAEPVAVIKTPEASNHQKPSILSVIKNDFKETIIEPRNAYIAEKKVKKTEKAVAKKAKKEAVKPAKSPKNEMDELASRRHRREIMGKVGATAELAAGVTLVFSGFTDRSPVSVTEAHADTTKSGFEIPSPSIPESMEVLDDAVNNIIGQSRQQAAEPVISPSVDTPTSPAGSSVDSNTTVSVPTRSEVLDEIRPGVLEDVNTLGLGIHNGYAENPLVSDELEEDLDNVLFGIHDEANRRLGGTPDGEEPDEDPNKDKNKDKDKEDDKDHEHNEDCPEDHFPPKTTTTVPQTTTTIVIPTTTIPDMETTTTTTSTPVTTTTTMPAATTSTTSSTVATTTTIVIPTTTSTVPAITTSTLETTTSTAPAPVVPTSIVTTAVLEEEVAQPMIKRQLARTGLDSLSLGLTGSGVVFIGDFLRRRGKKIKTINSAA